MFDFLKKKKSVSDLIFEKLNSDLIEAKFSGNWKLKQEIQLKLKWLEIAKNQIEIWKDLLPERYLNATGSDDVSALTIDEIVFPKELNDQEILHYKFSEIIFKDYGKVLADSGKYQKCFYKPASILPYPKDYIRRAIQFSKHCLKMENPLFSPPPNKKEILDNLGGIEAFLENFVDASEDELPSEMRENMMKGSEYK